MDEISEINVDALEYKTVKAPHVLYAHGVGPCVAVGALYFDKAYLIHAPILSHDISGIMSEMLTDVRKDIRFKDEKNNILFTNGLEFYVLGAGFMANDPHRIDIEHKRQEVLERICKEGFGKAKMIVDWCRTGYVQSIYLHPDENHKESKAIIRSTLERALIDRL